eukprot:TRINITY_DN2587_c0_g1_i1.p1 TRINITY_DN2587_c0_g1~~TRINITY_DN2587_c0_g1_i1.p1  ORF type:complete len:453 (+),score=126.28 TRINITY_DN2587_c0_g1_i1:28-1386(+)
MPPVKRNPILESDESDAYVSDFEDEQMEFERKADEFMQRMISEQKMADDELKAHVDREFDEDLEEEENDEDIPFGESRFIATEDRPLSSDREAIHERIQTLINILSQFKQMSEPGVSRQAYMNQLKQDLAVYYEYIPELVERFLSMFSPAEAIDFMEKSEMPRPVIIRTNTLKCKRRDLLNQLRNRGVHLEPVKWSKEAIQVFESRVPIGATPEYLAGFYMRQTAASLLPVIALAPEPGEKCLDVCSAPGGKTAHMAALMKNTGFLVANDLSRERLVAVSGNLHRLSVRNTMIINYDGRMLPNAIGPFDRILLDAPCSGLGVIDRDASVKLRRTDDDIHKRSHIQRQLILKAFDLLKVGGTLVYSTCSITAEENEGPACYLLKERKGCVKCVDTGLPFGDPGFTKTKNYRFLPQMKLARRYYPHKHNLHGFFVCKFVKTRKYSAPKNEVVEQ